MKHHFFVLFCLYLLLLFPCDHLASQVCGVVDFSHPSFVSLVSCFVNDALCVLKRIDH